MKAVFSARPRSYSSAPRPVFCGLIALISICAYTITAQPDASLVKLLDSIAGVGVRENRAVRITDAVVRRKDTLLLEVYGKSDVESDVPMTVDTVIPIGSTTKQFTAAAIVQLHDQLNIGEDRRGFRYIGHDGGGFGFSSQVRWYRDGQLSVVVLTNSEPDNITLVTESLAAAALPPPRAAGPFKDDASLLTGKYKGPGRSIDMVIDVTPTLLVRRHRFLYDERRVFVIDGVQKPSEELNCGTLIWRTGLELTGGICRSDESQPGSC